MKFDPVAFLKDPPTFNESVLDYGRVDYDPRQDPLFISHAVNNGGKYPPEFNQLLERHLEDQSKFGNKKYIYWKKIRDLSFQRVERTKTIE